MKKIPSHGDYRLTQMGTSGFLRMKLYIQNQLHFHLWVSMLKRWSSKVVLVVKNLPAKAGDIRKVVQSLGWEHPLGKGMATHSSIHSWRIPWMEEPCRLQSMGSQRVGHN